MHIVIKQVNDKKNTKTNILLFDDLKLCKKLFSKTSIPSL